jgi:hypothetical protein
VEWMAVRSKESAGKCTYVHYTILDACVNRKPRAGEEKCEAGWAGRAGSSGRATAWRKSCRACGLAMAGLPAIERPVEKCPARLLTTSRRLLI